MAPDIALQVLSTAAFYAFAVFNWLLYLLLGIKGGTFFSEPTEQEGLQLAIARDKFWNLSKQPLPGFYHAFFKLRNGLKLHYICNRARDETPSGHLVIFFHGFPDSSMMWRHLFKEPAIPAHSATLVCVDLPGYGGSDSFKKYDTTVLEALTEFVVAMRDKYAQSGFESSTFIVGHDWGCALAFRLAAEAPCLADRFILSNGPLVQLGFANSERVLSSSSKIFRQFYGAPIRQFACLSKSIQTARPLIWQIILFGYIFAFNLPKAMVQYLGSGGNLCFLRGALRAAHGKNKAEWNAQESLASTLGPSLQELDSEITGETYGNTLSSRARSPGAVFWNMTSYYRDGLASGTWTKSLETIADLYNIECDESNPTSPARRRSSSASSALFGEQYKGSLRAPATILWGEKDLAVSKEICLDGIGDYLARASEVILLPRSGHWVAVEKEGRAALSNVIASYTKRDHSPPPMYVTKNVQEVYDGAVMMVKK